MTSRQKVREHIPDPNRADASRNESLQWINGKVVDLSKAREYYRKLWEAVLPRVSGEVANLGPHSYKLSARFYRHFMRHLNQVTAYYVVGPNINSVDLVALALRRAGWDFGTRIRSAGREGSPLELWPKNRPLSEAWSRLGTLPSGTTWQMILEDPGAGRELVPWQAELHSDNPKIAVVVRSSSNMEALPKITIEIEGEPVCLVLKAMEQQWKPVKDRSVQRDAARTWQSLVRSLSILIGARQPKPGRAKETVYEKAAMLHHLHGLTLREVTRRLCPLEHEHGSRCQQRFRKGIGEFWKRQRKAALALPPVGS